MVQETQDCWPERNEDRLMKVNNNDQVIRARTRKLEDKDIQREFRALVQRGIEAGSISVPPPPRSWMLRVNDKRRQVGY